LKNPALPERLKIRYRALYTTLLNKYWIDEIYDTLFVQPVKIVSTYLLWKFCDVVLIDGVVNGTGQIIARSGRILRRLQSGSTRSYAAWILFGAVVVVFYFGLFGS
jgi:NADH-quinone oxidoreductase subunit L